jgi:NAD(P)H-dependent FMN reductase
MTNRVLVLYGSYRSDRIGIRLANDVLGGLQARGEDVEIVDAKAIALPMLDRMYKEYAPGSAPQAMETLASKIRASDAFVFITGEYNWGPQPGLKNLTDHFLEEWFWRPVRIGGQKQGGKADQRKPTPPHATPPGKFRDPLLHPALTFARS